MARRRLFFVYEIRNRLDGKSYIGKTSGRSCASAVDARFKRHLRMAEGGNGFKLHAAIRKHSADNFEIGCLYICQTERGAFALEVAEIARRSPAYNLTKGGDGVSGYVLTEQHRARLSLSQKERYRKYTSDQIAVMVEHLKNHPPKYDAAHRAKISKALTGIRRGPMRPEQIEAMRQRLTGRVLTSEHCSKISAAKKGKPYHRKKLTPAMAARKSAREAGARFYCGEPCKSGHTERYVSTRQCRECHRIYYAARTVAAVQPEMRP